MRYLLTILLAAFVAMPAFAGPCGPYAGLVEAISGERFREVRVGGGLDTSGDAAVELWVNPDTGTWTLLAVAPDRHAACLVTGGNGWRFGDEPAPGDPA